MPRFFGFLGFFGTDEVAVAVVLPDAMEGVGETVGLASGGLRAVEMAGWGGMNPRGGLDGNG